MEFAFLDMFYNKINRDFVWFIKPEQSIKVVCLLFVFVCILNKESIKDTMCIVYSK